MVTRPLPPLSPTRRLPVIDRVCPAAMLTVSRSVRTVRFAIVDDAERAAVYPPPLLRSKTASAAAPGAKLLDQFDPVSHAPPSGLIQFMVGEMSSRKCREYAAIEPRPSGSYMP